MPAQEMLNRYSEDVFRETGLLDVSPFGGGGEDPSIPTRNRVGLFADPATRPCLPHAVDFLRSFLRSPAATGAIAPSSRWLARRMTEWLDLRKACVVAEFGPGTGSFTQAILENLPAGCSFLMFEVNSDFVKILRRRFSGALVFQESVQNVRHVCDRLGIQGVDCVVSGLPWAAFSERRQRDLLDATTSVLRPGGQFVTFAYLQGLLMPGGRRFRALLDQYFSRISRSQTVWMNPPPAFVYRCTR